MNVEIGEKVTVDKETRTVTELRRNSEGGFIVIWANGIQSKGGCTPSLWNEWRKGIGHKDRR